MSQPNGSQMPPRPGAVPGDLTAVLSAMQDQLDDLAAVVEAQQRRLDALEHTRPGQPQHGRTQPGSTRKV